MSAAHARIAEIPTEMISDPVAWFFLEHERHRRFCQLVDETADTTEFHAERLTYILDFMRNELARHIVDEEEDLFPLLRRRALPDDRIEVVLRRLCAEHKADGDSAHDVRDHLDACLRARKAPGQVEAARAALKRFAAQELSHLALENAVVLPIARLRLTQADLRRLSRRLAERRRIVLESA